MSKKAPLVFVVLLLSLPVFAQDSVLTKFLNYRKNVFQEKLYVHVDRDVYLTGETMWLKVYAVDASLHRPADVSRVVYIDIVDKDNQPVVQEMIAMENGIAKGTVFVPASVGSGTYLVRAYTNWMKNFGADSYFRKVITIVNSFVKLETPAAAAAPAFDIQFFAEGGTLVNGVEGKVGFKVTDRGGHGVDFKGAVIDNAGDTIIRFRPLKFGMGSFIFTPQSGKSYTAVVRVAGAPASMVAMPQATNEGFALRVIDRGEMLAVEVSFMPSIQNGPAVYLLAHTRQQIAKAERKNIAGGKATFEIRKGELSPGVTHITVFDERSRPVAERLYFKAPGKELTLSVAAGQETYRSRTKVTLGIQSNRAIPQMSLSVFRMDSLSNGFGDTHINEYLHLTSDLKGLVESPGYYFSGEPDAAEAADNLMLTQGWRRFTWNEVLNKKPVFTYAPEYHGHFVQGVVKEFNGTPASGILAYVSVPGKIVDVYTSRSDAKGGVSFEMKHFFGGSNVMTVTDSLHRVDLLSPFSSDATSAKWPALTLSPSVDRTLLARAVGMQVQSIYFDDKYSTPKVDSSAFYGKADETYYLDDYTRFPVMEEVMREYVPGVLVRKQKDKFKFYLLDMVNKKPIYETPMILLDGVPVFDVDKIMSYDPLKVQKLEVVTRKFYHGMSTFPGIVSYTTYKGDLDGFELDKRYVNIEYQGLQLQREFYSPRHDYTRESEARMPDQRSLLYWDANVSIDATGKNNIQFFTSDVPGTYQVVVEGMTPDGHSGFATHVFKVMR